VTADYIDHEGDMPIYLQLANLIRQQIHAGELLPHRPIPSKRTLTQRHGIAGVTVDKATRILKAEGLLHAVPGKGLYVRAPDDRGTS
jgi:GntR family transcriptional regulator